MTGIARHPTFELVDHHGRAVTESDYRGSLTMIFFGFTNCAMVCPRALERLTDVLERLGDRSALIRPLYITVDPERDTPDALSAFLVQRAPAFTGLTGSRNQIDAAKSSFRVFAQRRESPDAPDGYDVPHTAITYFLSPDSTFLSHIGDGVPVDTVVERVGKLLDGAQDHNRG